jgi:hypothetical protein
MIKSRISWAGHAARMGEKMHTNFWSENLKENGNLGNLGRII